MTALALAPGEAHVHKFDRVTEADILAGTKCCRHCGRPKMKEKDFRRQVVDLAEMTGWEHVGFRPAQTKFGWRTPGTGSMAEGWPDLTLVHPRTHRLLFLELKGDGGKLSPDQVRVLDVLRLIPCAEVHVWWPDDIQTAGEVLTP